MMSKINYIKAISEIVAIELRDELTKRVEGLDDYFKNVFTTIVCNNLDGLVEQAVKKYYLESKELKKMMLDAMNNSLKNINTDSILNELIATKKKEFLGKFFDKILEETK